jgi:hypothetical protein
MNDSLCKKCKSEQFVIEQVIKNNKTKYYRICEKCNYRNKISVKRTARRLYNNLCVLEAYNQYKGENLNKNFDRMLRKRTQLLKEYKYVYNNLQIFIEYIFRNNSHKGEYGARTFSYEKLMTIIKQYKNIIDDKDCGKIISELFEE